MYWQVQGCRSEPLGWWGPRFQLLRKAAATTDTLDRLSLTQLGSAVTSYSNYSWRERGGSEAEMDIEIAAQARRCGITSVVVASENRSRTMVFFTDPVQLMCLCLQEWSRYL
jgi:hypothetical protein